MNLSSLGAAALEPMMDVEDVARLLKLYVKHGPRKGKLNTKRVYELKIRKTRVGRRVRYSPADVRMYLNLHSIKL